jgi:RNA-dependent RNA polymerase
VENKFAAPIWDVLEEEFASTHPHLEPSSSQSVLDELLTNKINLNFSVRYQLDVCISNGYLKEHNITRPFLERLASMIPIEAVDILETIASKQDVCYDPMAILDVPVKVNIKKNIPSYCVLSRSATITPTTIHVASPLVETSNRIIRKHAADSDRFIRIKFSDEKTEGRIHSQSNGCSEAVFERIKQALKNGIVVAGRYYAFLAFGNSQFRDHGAYFYAPTGSHSADTIRLSMGSFQHIKSVAKFGARLGQCFSTTRPITSISCEIQRIPDIERNGFTFTDGVGKLSSLLAQMAAKELGLQNSFEDPPSLFQFRLAGCKGVLAIDPTLMGKVVCIRPSQYKFKAENLGLEIIRSSTFATACLNRQLIIVLSTLGVSDLTFLRKQQEMVNDLEKATKEETFALGKLQSIIDFNQTTLTMATMILDGFMATKDPFIMSLLQLWRAFHIKYLKEKARINIEKGAFVLGCIDETATLRGHYNNPQSRPDTTREQKLATLPEIFLQISDPSKKGYYKVIEGTCILARNPSLHAGDIRIVRAVDNSALRHLKNAVVLPQTGDRDIANMCSGGDLDGDDYLVMWDADLLPEIINEVPMDFTPEKPLESNEPITIESVIDFFVTYMKNDSLPRIALAHLAQADFNNGGVRDNKCLELARLHSQAVDYPKSGIPAMMDRNLLPRKYPHFMESKYRPAERTYKSTNVLGMLYDQVGLVNFKPQYENPFDNRILDAFELDYEILGQASSLKDSYDTALRRLMAKHDIRTEFEAWSVFVLSHNQESRDYTFAEDFGISIGNLKKQYRNLVREASGATSSTGGFVKLEPFIAAMYTVTAREMEKALIECQTLTTIEGQQVPMRKMDPENMPFISFPWLFVHELGRIATKGPTSRSVPLVEQAGQRLESHKAYSDVDDRKNPDQLTAPDSGSEVVHTPSPSDGSESRSLETQDTLRIDRVGRSKVSAFDRLSLLGLD